MKLGKSGRDLIVEFEGLELERYKCSAGHWTIGIGHLITDDEEYVTITEEKAWELFAIDSAEAVRAVNKFVKVALNQNQFDALVSFTFNLGAGSLGKSTLLKKLNKGDYLGAANEFKRWIYAGGRISNGLKRRRTAEKELFLKQPEKEKVMDIKAGLKTSEFWMTFLTSNILMVLDAVGVALSEATIAGVVAMAVGYAVKRGWVKAASSKAESEMAINASK